MASKYEVSQIENDISGLQSWVFVYWLLYFSLSVTNYGIWDGCIQTMNILSTLICVKCCGYYQGCKSQSKFQDPHRV